MKVDVVILNFNGGQLLLDCLPSIAEAVKRSAHECRLVLLDNGSTDQSDTLAKKQVPELELAYAPRNLCLCSYNDYLNKSSCDVAVLLNNDIRVDENFLDPLVHHFMHPQDLFMVTPKCLSYDGSYYEGGITQFRMKGGIFWASSRYPGHEKLKDDISLTMAAGYGAFDRLKFIDLGGYDTLYLPGRLEDTDLCFRAWKRGWKLLYDPASVVYHKGGASFHKHFGESRTLRINHRNAFLFTWKNIQDPIYLTAHLLCLPLRLFIALLRGQKEFYLGFFDALPLLRTALDRRKGNRHAGVRTDREIFDLL